MKRLAALLALLAAPALAQDAWQPRTIADLILLDKIRAQPTAVAVKVGESASFGALTVAVRSCFVRPPDQPADATAYVDVTTKGGDLFHGWVFAKTPAVSQLEDPVYDLRLAGCR